MSKVVKLFGSRKKDKAPSPQDALQRMLEVEEMLHKKSDYLEKKIDVEIATAKRYGTKNKTQALHALKRKKALEKQLSQIDGTLSTIEFQREALENAATNTEVLTVMGQGAQTLKAVHKKINLDTIDTMMDEIADQQGIAKEVGEAISSSTAFGQQYDEDELLAELEELEQDELCKQMSDMQPMPSRLAEVPSTVPMKSKGVEIKDEDTRQLEAWAAF